MKIKTIFVSMLFAVLFATTAFAAGKTWALKADGWHYLDAEGEDICDVWVNGKDGFKYHVNDDGIMDAGKLIEDGDATYFVDSEGKMIKNSWQFVQLEEDEDKVWVYFKNNGKAVVDGWELIDGAHFFFKNRAMQTGFISEAGEVIEDEEDAYVDALYFCDKNGARYSGWLKAETKEDFVWVYFDKNGKKVTDKTKVINGCKYLFNEDGAMQTEFWASPADATPSAYFKTDGALVKNGWVYSRLNDDEEDAHWYFAKNDGSLVKDCVKKINEKYYAFNKAGQMLTGFVMVATDADGIMRPISEGIKAEDFVSRGFRVDDNYYMYFAENADPMLQGWASTAKIAITCDEYNLTFDFDKKGLAKCDGYSIRKNYFYIHSILVNAEYSKEVDDKYGVYYGDKEYVINLQTGKAYSKGTFTDKEEEIKYVFNSEGEVEAFTKDDNGKYTIPTSIRIIFGAN